jgi:hypothetical protein
MTPRRLGDASVAPVAFPVEDSGGTGFSSSAIRDALAVLVALLIEVATAGTRAARPMPEAPRETVPARGPQKPAEPPSVVEALSRPRICRKPSLCRSGRAWSRQGLILWEALP